MGRYADALNPPGVVEGFLALVILLTILGFVTGFAQIGKGIAGKVGAALGYFVGFGAWWFVYSRGGEAMGYWSIPVLIGLAFAANRIGGGFDQTPEQSAT